MAKENELATTTKSVELNTPEQIMKFANNLKKMVVDENLYSKIQGKNYVNVEGWQMAGAFTNMSAIIESTENLSEGNNYKYQAAASLYDQHGNKVGYGVAICSNGEPGKKGFAEYAVLSMAQTRAIGKAYRNKLGWLLKAAGYETTPAEEMDAIDGEEVDKKHDMEVKAAIVKLKTSKDMSELRSNFASLSRSMTLNEQVQAAKNELKKRFGGDDESA